jgi:hypothetical protein
LAGGLVILLIHCLKIWRGVAGVGGPANVGRYFFGPRRGLVELLANPCPKRRCY